MDHLCKSDKIEETFQHKESSREADGLYLAIQIQVAFNRNIHGIVEGIAMKNNMTKELYLFMWKTGFIWLTKHYCGGVILLGTLISGLAIYFDGAWWVPIAITLVFLSVNALFAAVLLIISRNWRSQGIDTYNNSATPER